MVENTCKVTSCNAHRGIIEGYCRTHSSYRANQLKKAPVPSQTPPSSASNRARNASASSTDVATKNDILGLHTKLDAYLEEIKHLKSANLSLSNQVVELEDAMADLQKEKEELKKENKDLKAKSNVRFYKHDALNQYGRHENLRIYNIKEAAQGQSENCIQLVKDVAQKLNIPLNDTDIERCHRLGKPRTNGTNRHHSKIWLLQQEKAFC